MCYLFSCDIAARVDPRKCGSTYDFECVCDNADGHELLAVVAAVHHQGVGKTLNDWALCLPEALDGVLASGVGEVDRCADVDVVAVVEFLSAWFFTGLPTLLLFFFE